MNNNLLPAYSVFKVLADEHTSIKDVLKSFIATFFIKEFKKKSFLINDFSKRFNSFYGFNIPNAVLKNVLVDKFSCKIGKGGWYSIDESKIENEKTFVLEDYKNNTEKLLNDFLNYAKSFKHIDLERIKKDFIDNFTTNIENLDSKEIISSYIIKIQNSNSELKNLIDDLNYGSIIYRGITMDLPEIKTWNDELTIYLNTDILFDINGFNGEVYYKSINEFLDLVKEINRNKEYIHLRYFNITIREIDRFFSAAEKILCNKNQLSESEGMTYLLNKCVSISDIAENKGLFLAKLKEEKILYDEDNKIDLLNKESIYDEEERESYIDKNFNFFNFTDEFLIKIEELRGGLKAKNLNKAQYVFLTRTDEILRKSKEKTNISQDIGLSPTLEYMITTFWFQLNKGFGLSALHSLDIVLRSKKIYAGIVADEQKSKIQEAQIAYKEKKLTKDQAYEVIATFKQFSSKPENITSDTVNRAEELNDKTLNEILESNEIKKQKMEDNIITLTEERDKANSRIQAISEDAELGKKIRLFIEKLRMIGRNIIKTLRFVGVHVIIPLIVVLIFAFILKRIKKEDLDWSFIFSNWISLTGVFVITEFCTWIKKIFHKERK